MNDRLTRQQMRDDPLLNRTAESADFIQKHSRMLIGVVAVLLVAVVATSMMRNSAARSENQAAGQLTLARADYTRGALEPAAARLTDLVENHSGTRSGKRAALYLGHVRYDQGLYEDAERHYQTAWDGFGDDLVLGTAALRGLAASRENLGRHEQAAADYDQLLGRTKSGSLYDEYRMAVARNYLKLGKRAEATEILEDLSNSPENVRIAQEAKLQLAETQRMRQG